MNIIVLLNVTPEDNENLKMVLDHTLGDIQITEKAKKSRSDINRQYYEKRKSEKSEIQTNSDEIQTEVSLKKSEKSEFVQEERENEKESEKERSKEKEQEKVKEKEELINIYAEPKIQTKPTKPIKHRHGNFQHVFLTDDEFSKIQTDFPDWQKRIQKFDDYLENNPSKHYANHNLTIRNWANKEAEEAKQKQTVQIRQPSQNKTAWEMLKEKGLV